MMVRIDIHRFCGLSCCSYVALKSYCTAAHTTTSECILIYTIGSSLSRNVVNCVKHKNCQLPRRSINRKASHHLQNPSYLKSESKRINRNQAMSDSTHPTSASGGEDGLQGNTSPAADDNKVKVHFMAVGSAPMMKKTKFLIGANQQFSSVISFLRKMLKMGNESSLFLYCNSAFAPGPDECVGDLRDCFNTRGELVINYSLQVRHHEDSIVMPLHCIALYFTLYCIAWQHRLHG
jgi:ubiquitin-like protein ATG12